MIKLERLNGTPFFLNPELIEQIEDAGDTVITLTTGNNFIVKESPGKIIEKIISFRRKIFNERKDSLPLTLESQKQG